MSMIRKAATGAALGFAALALVACTTETGSGGSGSDPGTSAAFATGYQMLIDQNYVGARDAFLAIVANDPDNAYAHLNLGVAYEELGDLQLAKTHYNLALDTGASQPIAGTVEDGVVQNDVNTTVGALATRNLTALGI